MWNAILFFILTFGLFIFTLITIFSYFGKLRLNQEFTYLQKFVGYYKYRFNDHQEKTEKKS